MPELLQPFLSYGLAGILIFFIGYALFLIGRWLAPKIDLIIDSHLDFVKTANNRLGNVETKMTNLEDVAERQTAILERMETNHSKILNNQSSMIDILNRNTTNGKTN